MVLPSSRRPFRVRVRDHHSIPSPQLHTPRAQDFDPPLYRCPASKANPPTLDSYGTDSYRSEQSTPPTAPPDVDLSLHHR
ncbi:hypothetical protein GLOTRDRAFT_99091 [Gloeophyllum trabeum ATCC 11539]|uniref:Uncharacterized protein n=1 Tax=Gloeophyllum trabeum (strain ATCC 11539 / FP-39264 / Madison 617) TaxID=670483 RepID=S7QHJ7_GLOTA|nr:uncharacterized protein GLOTRDRAFT_99091 [Gloeophyllum trabeum ATCC 11539]EPQ58642.1 hypothetical protein GLOTRDRAFT_99091 [Gloeophyllum trabeum ATCC 11539]